MSETLSEEMERVVGTIALVRPEWLYRVRRLERVVELASQINNELRILSATNREIQERSQFH